MFIPLFLKFYFYKIEIALLKAKPKKALVGRSPTRLITNYYSIDIEYTLSGLLHRLTQNMLQIVGNFESEFHI